MPRASIAGPVKNEQGPPIARARVCADATSPELSAEDVRAPRCVDSNATGGYSIENLLAARYEITAVAKGYRPAATDRVLAGGEHETVDFALRGGGAEVTGTVS